MAVTQAYTLTAEGLAEEANNGKNIILGKLYDDGLLSQEQFKYYSMYYGFIVGQPSFFSDLWKRFMGKPKTGHMRYMLIKAVNLPNQKELKNDPKCLIVKAKTDTEKDNDEKKDTSDD